MIIIEIKIYDHRYAIILDDDEIEALNDLITTYLDNEEFLPPIEDFDFEEFQELYDGIHLN